MIRRLLTIALLSGLAACGGIGEPAVTDAWVRLPAVEGRPAAAYFEFTAGRDAAVLTGITTPLATRAELHETIRQDDGAMSMAAIREVQVAPAETIRFEPSGKHVMLFGVTAGAAPGATAPLTLRFADGSTVQTEAKLVGAGDPAPGE